MRGADLLVHTLREVEVDTIFTLSGNQIMPVFDACFDAGINLIHVRHEAAAVYMADAWAQLTGNIGVALVTAGPGFANCLSALYSARANESPVVLLSGDSPTTQDGNGAFQELQQTDISKPMVKSSIRLHQLEYFQSDIVTAIRTARSGRPGPVHVALPFDVLVATGVGAMEEIIIESATTPDAPLVKEINEFLGESNNSVVLTGPSLARSYPNRTRLADHLQTPIIPMESPRGLKDPILGSLTSILGQAERVVLAAKPPDFSIGFGQSPTFHENCKFMLIDPEIPLLERAKRLLGDNLLGAHQADTNEIVNILIALSVSEKYTNPERQQWCDQVAAAIAARNRDVTSESGRILPTELCDAVQRILDAADDPILVCDGGEFGQWVQALVHSSTRIINGPAGAIGGGICYAIAAKICRPSATVVTLMGDGTVGFHLSEFETAVRYKAPIIAIVGNDARWNAEYQIQLRDYGEDRLIGCELDATRYDLAVSGLGGHGEHVTQAKDFKPALDRALDDGLPACINVEIESLPAP